MQIRIIEIRGIESATFERVARFNELHAMIADGKHNGLNELADIYKEILEIWTEFEGNDTMMELLTAIAINHLELS